MKRVRLLGEAEAEIDAALAWYRAEAPHRLAAFADAIEAALARIGREPESCPPVELPQDGPEIRRAPARGFPWGVFFLDARDGEIVVLAVAHARREPGYWRGRVG